MALVDLNDYKTAIANPEQVIQVFASPTNLATRWLDNWTTTVPIGTAPTTAVAPTRATAGSLQYQNATTGTLGIVGSNFSMGGGMVLIADRLSHQGGLSGIVTTAQTTNLPTAALTRYTNGAGVMLGLTIYTQIGTTATTVTATYTNQDGTGSRVTPLVAFGGTAFREVQRMFWLPLQVGDTGVRSVESVTVTATTGTAGAFGVVLFKPLYAVIGRGHTVPVVVDLITGEGGGGLPEIVDDACLFVSTMTPAGQAQPVAGSLFVTEW